MSDNNGGMTDDEARAFHGVFVAMTAVFILTGAVAHFLAWSWRPWL